MISGELLFEIQQEVTPFSISTGLGTDPATTLVVVFLTQDLAIEAPLRFPESPEQPPEQGAPEEPNLIFAFEEGEDAPGLIPASLDLVRRIWNLMPSWSSFRLPVISDSFAVVLAVSVGFFALFWLWSSLAERWLRLRYTEAATDPETPHQSFGDPM